MGVKKNTTQNGLLNISVTEKQENKQNSDSKYIAYCQKKSTYYNTLIIDLELKLTTYGFNSEIFKEIQTKKEVKQFIDDFEDFIKNVSNGH